MSSDLERFSPKPLRGSESLNAGGRSKVAAGSTHHRRERNRHGGRKTSVPALRVFVLIVASAILAGCSGGSDATHVQSPTPQAGPAGPNADAVAQVRGTCPLTPPNERTPPDNAAGMNHGNGAIWTAMWPHNVVIADPSYVAADGSVGMKWPWYRGCEASLRSPARGWTQALRLLLHPSLRATG
jgi:hypothetical protein